VISDQLRPDGKPQYGVFTAETRPFPLSLLGGYKLRPASGAEIASIKGAGQAQGAERIPSIFVAAGTLKLGDVRSSVRGFSLNAEGDAKPDYFGDQAFAEVNYPVQEGLGAITLSEDAQGKLAVLYGRFTKAPGSPDSWVLREATKEEIAGIDATNRAGAQRNYRQSRDARIFSAGLTLLGGAAAFGALARGAGTKLPAGSMAPRSPWQASYPGPVRLAAIRDLARDPGPAGIPVSGLREITNWLDDDLSFTSPNKPMMVNGSSRSEAINPAIADDMIALGERTGVRTLTLTLHEGRAYGEASHLRLTSGENLSGDGKIILKVSREGRSWRRDWANSEELYSGPSNPDSREPAPAIRDLARDPGPTGIPVGEIATGMRVEPGAIGRILRADWSLPGANVDRLIKVISPSAVGDMIDLGERIGADTLTLTYHEGRVYGEANHLILSSGNKLTGDGEIVLMVYRDGGTCAMSGSTVGSRRSGAARLKRRGGGGQPERAKASPGRGCDRCGGAERSGRGGSESPPGYAPGQVLTGGRPFKTL
jgi:hypothetical protein